MGSIQHLSEAITKELRKRLPTQRKTQRESLSLLIATMLEVRSPNTNDLAAAFPVETERLDMRQQRISRILQNEHIVYLDVMEPFSKEILELYKGTLVLSIDQSHIVDDLQLLMISLYWEGRSIPIIWSVHETGGNVGFEDQKPLFDRLSGWLPPDSKVVLMGDRFYGTVDLIHYCQVKGWDYRLRLKQNMLVTINGEESHLSDLSEKKEGNWEDVELTAQKIITNLGLIYEEGHPEPWFIAMSAKPSFYKTLDYSMRWGVESLFSDFKTRGFALEDTHLQHCDRIERLILVMALSVFWAVSTGMWDREENPTPHEKKSDLPKSISDLSIHYSNVA